MQIALVVLRRTMVLSEGLADAGETPPAEPRQAPAVRRQAPESDVRRQQSDVSSQTSAEVVQRLLSETLVAWSSS